MRTEKPVDLRVRVRTPSVPNYVMVTMPDGKEHHMSLADFSDEQLNIIVDLWKLDLFKNRDRQKQQKLDDEKRREKLGL